MNGTIPFETEDLSFRPFEKQDAEALLAYLNHPNLQGRRQIPWRFPTDFPLTLTQAEEIIDHWNKGEKRINFAVLLKVTGELVGHIDLDWGWDPHCPGIGMVIAPKHARKGLENQALDWALDYLFMNTPAHNIDINLPDWDAEGIEFVESYGFQQAGRFRRIGIRNGKYFDWLIYDIIRPEWLERKRS